MKQLVRTVSTKNYSDFKVILRALKKELAIEFPDRYIEVRPSEEGVNTYTIKVTIYDRDEAELIKKRTRLLERFLRSS